MIAEMAQQSSGRGKGWIPENTRGEGKVYMRPGRYLSHPERAAIRDAYENSDEPVRDIAKRFDVSLQAVSRTVRGLGGTVRPKGRRRNGKPSVDAAGYRIVPIDICDQLAVAMAYDNGRVLEHRLVMARLIGRPLRDTETVHHINGDRLDNRPENLQLRVGAHGRGVIMCCARCGSYDVVATRLTDSEVLQ